MPHILLILVIVHISHEDFLEGWNVVFSSLLGTCVHYSVVSDCDPMDMFKYLNITTLPPPPLTLAYP